MVMQRIEGTTVFSSFAPLCKQGLKQGLKQLLQSPAGRPLQRWYQGVGVSLLYHRLVPADRSVPAFSPNLSLEVKDTCFEQQMAYIAAHYHCLDLDTAITQLKRGQLTKGCAVVTFDDGYRDNLTLALPILEKYHVPATIYVTTGLLDRTCLAWWYEVETLLRHKHSLSFTWRQQHYEWSLDTPAAKQSAFLRLHQMFLALEMQQQQALFRCLQPSYKQHFYDQQEMLSWKELGSLAKHPLITIGAHTIGHPTLRRESPAQLRRELQGAKQRLAHKLGQPITHLAYPFGGREQAGFREFQAAKRAGFASGTTTRLGHLHPKHQHHLLSLPRLTVDFHDDIDAFAWKLSGLVSMFVQRGQRVITY